MFVARYWDEVIAFQGTGSVSGAADAIEQVEAEGWKLDQASYAWVPQKNRGVEVLIFRKADGSAPSRPDSIAAAGAEV